MLSLTEAPSPRVDAALRKKGGRNRSVPTLRAVFAEGDMFEAVDEAELDGRAIEPIAGRAKRRQAV